MRIGKVAGIGVVSLVFAAAAVAARPAHTPALLPCDGDHPKAVRAPSACTILPANASFAEGVNLSGLRWQKWGTARATATGVEKGFHLPYSWVRVTVVAYGLTAEGYCTGYFRVYTHVRVTSKYGSKTVRTEGCAI